MSVKISYWTNFETFDAMVNDKIIEVSGKNYGDVQVVTNTRSEAQQMFSDALSYAHYVQDIEGSGVVLNPPEGTFDEAARIQLGWIIFGANKEGLASFNDIEDNNLIGGNRVKLLILTDVSQIKKTQAIWKKGNFKEPEVVIVKSRTVSQLLKAPPEYWGYK